jgi:hypothetical protein
MDNNLAQKFIKSHMDLSLLHAHNLAQSVKKFAKSDFALCSKDISEDRHSVCQSCEKFDAKEMFGLGKCLESSHGKRVLPVREMAICHYLTRK